VAHGDGREVESCWFYNEPLAGIDCDAGPGLRFFLGRTTLTARNFAAAGVVVVELMLMIMMMLTELLALHLLLSFLPSADSSPPVKTSKRCTATGCTTTP